MDIRTWDVHLFFLLIELYVILKHKGWYTVVIFYTTRPHRIHQIPPRIAMGRHAANVNICIEMLTNEAICRDDEIRPAMEQTALTSPCIGDYFFSSCHKHKVPSTLAFWTPRLKNKPFPPPLFIYYFFLTSMKLFI